MIIEWLGFYISIMFAMSVDNIFWIPDSPEWSQIRKNFKVFILFNREFGLPKNKEGWKYVWKTRVLEVLNHPRDIIPAVITSFILALIW